MTEISDLRAELAIAKRERQNAINFGNATAEILIEHYRRAGSHVEVLVEGGTSDLITVLGLPELRVQWGTVTEVVDGEGEDQYPVTVHGSENDARVIYDTDPENHDLVSRVVSGCEGGPMFQVITDWTDRTRK